MDKYVQIITTTEKKEDAQRIASGVLGQKLASCVQIIGPVISSYWWKNKIETSGEWICLIKSKKGLYKNVEKRIQELHPYEIPEIIAVPIIDGYKGYLNWIDDIIDDKK